MGAIGAIGAVAKVAGGVAGMGGSSRAAAAQEEQAFMHQQIAEQNAQIMMGRSQTAMTNAAHSGWLAGFAREQAALQNAINSRLGEAEWHASRKYASMVQDKGRAQKAAYYQAAKSTMAFGREDVRRHTRSGRKFQGKVRGSIAAAGVTEQGSPLEVMSEVAGQLELQALDILTKATAESDQLKYKGDLAEWEGNVQHQAIQYQGDMGRWNTAVKNWTVDQQAAITAADYMQQLHNAESQAEDYQQQAHIARLEGWSQSQGLMAQAAGTRAQGRASLFSSAAGAIGGLQKVRTAGT